MFRFHSGFRAGSLRHALARARRVARGLGITRVTEITRLDRVGIPVFASIRPTAAPGSLCVNSGKGLTAAEARVGAYMEAIEFAMGESHAHSDKIRAASPREVLDGKSRTDAILDLCPLVAKRIALDERLPCIAAQDLNGGSALVPAELVFFPFRLPSRLRLFGTSTNGLASGVTLTEATLHALLEVMEHDIASFEWVKPGSLLVAPETLPTKQRNIMKRLQAKGFSIVVRWLPNSYDVSCFHAVLWEPHNVDPIYISDGYGCHLDPEIALTRSLTEAIQSRTGFIHGARDDMRHHYAQFARSKRLRKARYARRLLARECRASALFDFTTAKNGAEGAKTLSELLGRLRTRLARLGITRILRVRLSPRRSPIVVVRVIVPLLEYFTPNLPRVGRRLIQFCDG